MLKAEAAFKILVNFCKKVGFSVKDSIFKALISVFSSGFLKFWGYKYSKMTVEEIRADHENYDKFPIGLRVLAVDDDPICLRLLETLLRKCQYHVTTSNQARMALNMLRENRDRFDLVISDVHMPDMDGFKLLELVGLEMDLPVIMLSANGDPKNVMKGVTHGACDYLVKPVRIEELKNIWQHVIRRKKSDSKSQNKCADEARTHKASGEAHGSPNKGKVDQNGKLNRKRKDEEDDSEDDGNESEDPTTQKRPRVVWSIELHRKFVAAVNQLGIEKAVPKRILDMMNVDGLTRENVASHLQKYRLYLKRISSVANHQVNMVAALGGRDAPFMRIGSLDGFGEFRNLAGPGRLTNVALSPYNTGGMLGRLNSPANVSLHNLTSSALIQPSPAQNLSNSTAVGKMHPFLSHASQNPSLFQGIPSSLELDQLQQNKCATGIPNFNAIDASRVVDVFNPGAVIASSSNSLDNNPKNQTLSGGRFGIQSSHNMASFNSESFYGSSNLLDPGAIESYKMQPNSMLSAGAFRVELPIDSARENNYSHGHLQNNPVELSTTNMASLPIEDSRKVQFQEGLVGDLHSTIQAPNQRWEDHRQNYGHNSNNNFGSLNSHVPADTIVSSLDGSLDQNSGIFDQKMHMFMNARSDGGASTLMQQNGNEKMATESRARSSENFLLEQPKFHGGFAPQGYDTLDVLVNSMIKQEQDATIPNYQFGFNDYSLGPGM